MADQPVRPELIDKGIPAAVGIVALAALSAWCYSYWHGPAVSVRPFNLDRPPAPALARPGAFGGPSSLPALAQQGPLSAQQAAAATVGTAAANANVPLLPGSWPGFRGPRGDNICTDGTPLARQWGPQGPAALWSVGLGEGYAGAAIRAGRVYVLDYDQGAQADALRCFSLADGTELWRRSYPSPVKRNHGMSRTVPAVTDRYVVTLGPRCVVMCTQPVTGKVVWTHDLVSEYGTTVPEWYAGQCPLIDGGRAIIAPAGKAMMVAFDCATGKTLWQTPNPDNWAMTHSSIAPVTFRGRRMYVYCASGGVVGVDARTGALLWTTPEWTVSTATVPTPVQVGDGRILLTGGYGAGAMLLQLEDQAGKVVPRVAQRLPASVCGSDQQTPIVYKGYVYAVIPGGQLACLDANGRQLWASGNLRRFGTGPYMVADGLMYLLNDSGTLTVVDPSPAGYRQVAEARIMDGQECWGPLAIAGGRLIGRDLTRMVCIDVARH